MYMLVIVSIFSCMILIQAFSARTILGTNEGPCVYVVNNFDPNPVSVKLLLNGEERACYEANTSYNIVIRSPGRMIRAHWMLLSSSNKRVHPSQLKYACQLPLTACKSNFERHIQTRAGIYFLIMSCSNFGGSVDIPFLSTDDENSILEFKYILRSQTRTSTDEMVVFPPCNIRCGEVCPKGSSDCEEGSYQCECARDRGYYGNDIDTCIDEDECAIGTHDCDTNAMCNNTAGGFECTCNPGYHGNGKICVKETSLSECHEGGVNCSCKGEHTNQSCYCDSGFNVTPGNGNCEDTDECDNGTSRCSHICFNNPGSYHCICFPGYHLAADGFTCLDIDECKANLHSCDVNAECSNTDGSFSCSCQKGYHGNGWSCFKANVCNPGTTGCKCLPSLSNDNPFQCLCDPGYLFNLDEDGVSCHDLDECSMGLHNCHPFGLCDNINGSFTCTCRKGFHGNGVLCIDIDECSKGLDDCGANHTCNNTFGSFTCSCSNGFYPSPDIPDLCIEGKPPDIRINPVVRPISELVYDVGNNFCLEDSDFINITAVLICETKEEIIPFPATTWYATLETGSKTSILHIAGNTMFKIYNNYSYLSIDLSEFAAPIERLSITCEKMNSINSLNSTSIISKCNDTHCQDGITNNCTDGCLRNGTDHTCFCNHAGYSLSNDGVSCQDIDECDPTNPIHRCDLESTYCINTVGSFSCGCLSGYIEANPPSHICEDVNECDLHLHDCVSNEKCVNTNGSFECVCIEGYEETRGVCVDQDECALTSHNCSANEDCKNTEGGYNCSCKEGYKRNENGCEDINECDDGICSHICENINGSFICSCQQGYILSSDNRTCSVSKTYLVSIVALLGVTIGVSLIIFWIVKKRIKKSNLIPISSMDLSNQISSTQVSWNSSDPLTYTRDEKIKASFYKLFFESKLLIPARHIQLVTKIGQGEFGLVYRSYLTGWQGRTTAEIVAVKTLKSFFTPNDTKDLMVESEKMRWFKHANVMSLIGVCIDAGETPYIVMPYMANGSLLTYLKRERPHLTIAEEAENEMIQDGQRKLLSICIQIAKGMSYLSAQKFVHRDLAARNCMIDDHFVIKVGDFGLTEDIYCRNYFKQEKEEATCSVKLPIKWMALESLLDGTFSEKTDVWSFGVTCWEIFSLGHTPYPTIHPLALIKLLQNGERLERPDNASCTHEVYDLIAQCWNKSPDNRPSFENLVHEIDTLLEGVAGYLEFSEYSD